MIETRSFEVFISTKDKYVTELPRFGWVVSNVQKVNSQKINVKNSFIEGTTLETKN